MPELSQTQRNESADKVEESIRFVLVAAIFGMVLVGVDFVTGVPFDDWRIDVLLLAGCVLGLWSFFEMRQLARKVRTDHVPGRPGPGMWFSSIAGILVSLAVSAGFGYVLGGLWLAVLLPAAEIVFMAILTARGVRRRRRTAH